MVNYSNGKIYKIESMYGDDIYIGSTTQTYLSQRMEFHRRDYLNYKNGSKKNKITSFILFDKYGVDNCFIILLENYPCKSKDELLSREAYYIKSLKCVNKMIPLRTHQQYNIDNREAIRKDCLERYHKNKDAINEKRYKKETCDLCNVSFMHKNKAQHIRSKTHQNNLLQTNDTTEN